MSDVANTEAVFLHSRKLSGFSFGPEHPFKPERGERVYRMCRGRNLFPDPRVRVEMVEEALGGIMERYHSPAYIEQLKAANSGDAVELEMLHYGIGTAENPVFAGVYDFAALSATASLRAARIVAEGAGSAFNPCGGFHHAYSDRASGFCYVNDIVIAISELLRAGKRVACVDIDAHHGDAVQAAYYDTDSVLTISLHESGKTLFPWSGFERETGDGDGEGFNINVPLDAGTDDEIFLALFRGIAMEALNVFEPEIIIGQFGTDMLATDPLTHLRLTNNGYIEAIEMLHRRFPRIVALGGGGYNLSDVERCWTLLWVELAGLTLEEGYGGALGGVFLGDASIEGADLRDMRHYTTGPVKDRLREHADSLISHFEREIRPRLRGG